MYTFLLLFTLIDPADALYRQNEVTPVDYLEFKHHSYSEMVAVSISAFSLLQICWLILFHRKSIIN